MDPSVVLRSFVRQLLCVANDLDNVQTEVIEQCAWAKRDGLSGLSYETCKDLILKSINLYPKTTLVLDAFDESDKSTNNLVDTLIELIERSTRPVKIFISSRTGRGVTKSFEKMPTIIVNVEKNLDIEKLLVNLRSEEWFSSLPENIRLDISETLATRNRGVWVSFYASGIPLLLRVGPSANFSRKHSLGRTADKPAQKTHIPRLHWGHTA